jgi:hypothetical protein
VSIITKPSCWAVTRAVRIRHRSTNTADGAFTVVKIEEDYAHAVYATLGEGNVPVFCSRETWKAWWEANPGGKVVKSEQSGGFVTEITFTGFSSERDGPLKFWTVDSHNKV